MSVMHLPCGHVADSADGAYICPICESSTEEEIDVSGCLHTSNNLKYTEEKCLGKRTTFFFPCLCHPFCNSCTENYFERQKTGFERCYTCNELIENIYEMQVAPHA